MAAQINNQIIEKVRGVYDWLAEQIKEHSESAGQCRQCGKCCAFDDYDHRLFVTTPEMIYFETKVGTDVLKEMTQGVCSYNKDGKCSVYEYRFAGCRVFCCNGDKDFQSELIEKAIKKFKEVCDEYGVEYRYGDLRGFEGV